MKIACGLGYACTCAMMFPPSSTMRQSFLEKSPLVAKSLLQLPVLGWADILIALLLPWSNLGSFKVKSSLVLQRHLSCNENSKIPFQCSIENVHSWLYCMLTWLRWFIPHDSCTDKIYLVWVLWLLDMQFCNRLSLPKGWSSNLGTFTLWQKNKSGYLSTDKKQCISVSIFEN